MAHGARGRDAEVERAAFAVAELEAGVAAGLVELARGRSVMAISTSGALPPENCAGLGLTATLSIFGAAAAAALARAAAQAIMITAPSRKV